ncbi:hypothetical protein SCP_0902060 [Sparassis crispa]|uniref:Uncharacterized protein n=1 Tax=Sparassis crispa TaxID=139825 RepID=A0A401GVS4_9APHY|nr:hypothetical protein SCP_0902060 [Sparassis crispa]GBE86327.1 hypothetical protein SCP_0902060 [Sparassis crispa]
MDADSADSGELRDFGHLIRFGPTGSQVEEYPLNGLIDELLSWFCVYYHVHNADDILPSIRDDLRGSAPGVDPESKTISNLQQDGHSEYEEYREDSDDENLSKFKKLESHVAIISVFKNYLQVEWPSDDNEVKEKLTNEKMKADTRKRSMNGEEPQLSNKRLKSITSSNVAMLTPAGGRSQSINSSGVTPATGSPRSASHSVRALQ